MADKLFEEFEQREWEGKTLKLGDDEYTQNSLPPRDKIEAMIRLSMDKRGNNGENVVEKNVHSILSAFSPLLRKKTRSVISKSIAGNTYNVSTTNLEKQSTSASMLRQDRTVYITNNWESEITDEEQRAILQEIIDDDSLPRSAFYEKDYCYFKTPVTTVITSSKPERQFVDLLCKKENSDILTSWIKSRDRNFYEIEYSCRYGSGNSKTRKYYHSKFNPDFFIKIVREDVEYFLIVEIKADQDDCDDNKAKYRYAVQHFQELNNRLQKDGVAESYIFHFLSPEGYTTFFEHLRNGSVLKGQDTFRCGLETLLEHSEE